MLPTKSNSPYGTKMYFFIVWWARPTAAISSSWHHCGGRINERYGTFKSSPVFVFLSEYARRSNLWMLWQWQARCCGQCTLRQWSALLLLLMDSFRTWVDFVRLVLRPAGKSIWESVERLAGFCLFKFYQLMNVCVLSSSSATAMVCAHKL